MPLGKEERLTIILFGGSRIILPVIHTYSAMHRAQIIHDGMSKLIKKRALLTMARVSPLLVYTIEITLHIGGSGNNIEIVFSPTDFYFYITAADLTWVKFIQNNEFCCRCKQIWKIKDGNGGISQYKGASSDC